jgi:RNA polymerase sigma-70 factor (sigma-E family)
MGQDDSTLHAFIDGRRHHLFRAAFLLCGDRDEAEDLVQTALLKVVQAWRRIQRIDNVDAYARKTLVNVFIASRRRMWRREQPHGQIPDRPAQAHDLDTGIAVQAALARLPVKQRTVLVLRYWEDLSVESTADVLGMRPGTVRSHASRGVAALRASMSREMSRENAQLHWEEA